MVIGSLNWATKVKVWKGYFCIWLRKKWPTTELPQNTESPSTSPFLSFLLEFQKKITPIKMHCLKSWPPPLYDVFSREKLPSSLFKTLDQKNCICMMRFLRRNFIQACLKHWIKHFYIMWSYKWLGFSWVVDIQMQFFWNPDSNQGGEQQSVKALSFDIKNKLALYRFGIGLEPITT